MKILPSEMLIGRVCGVEAEGCKGAVLQGRAVG